MGWYYRGLHAVPPIIITRWPDWGYLFYCEIGSRLYKLFLLRNTNMIHELISEIIHDLMICTTVWELQNMKLNMHKLYAAYCISLSATVASVILYAHASFNRHKTCVNGLLYCRLEDSSVHWPRFISVTIDRPIFIKTDRPIFINFAIINLLLPMSRCVLKWKKFKI